MPKEVIQYGLPAAAVLVVGVLAFVSQWAAPLRNDRAIVIQEIEALEKIRKLGNVPGMTEAAADLAPVIRRRIEAWNWRSETWYLFARIAFNMMKFAAVVFCADIALAVFYIVRGDVTEQNVPVLDDPSSRQSVVTDYLGRSVGPVISLAIVFYLAAGLVYMWRSPAKFRLRLRVPLWVVGVALLMLLYLAIIQQGPLLPR